MIRTPRLLLRPWARDDADQVLEYASDEEWGRYLPVPRPYTAAHAREFIADQMGLDPRERCAWAIELDGRVVGGIDISIALPERAARMGYSLARSLWERGLATEAAVAVVATSFEALPELDRVEASVDPRNVASVRVAEKIGMERAGSTTRKNVIRGQTVDEALYTISRASFRERQNPDASR